MPSEAADKAIREAIAILEAIAWYRYREPSIWIDTQLFTIGTYEGETKAIPRKNGQIEYYLYFALSDVQPVVGANRMITWQRPDGFQPDCLPLEVAAIPKGMCSRHTDFVEVPKKIQAIFFFTAIEVGGDKLVEISEA